MLVLLLLVIWSAIGILWWLLAWFLVTKADHRSSPVENRGYSLETLSIFKPLPSLGDEGLALESEGLESFICQLDDSAELLLGAHEADRTCVLSFIDKMREKYPKAQVQVIFDEPDEAHVNPKIAWQRILVRHATGELWLWSDADIVVPPYFLQRAREEFARCGARLLTFPYAIRKMAHRSALFDALFVNVELLPGVLFLRLWGQVDFGLGAAMLFRRDDFLQCADWDRLDRSLADDFVLGQLFKPVCIGSMTVSTVTDSANWKTAIGHYLRWVKTIRWCRPAGYAGQALSMPVMGWLIYAVMHPMTGWAWMGLAIMMQVDVFFVWKICTGSGCRLKNDQWLTVELWTLGRALSWMLCWLPFPVTWRAQTWWRPQLQLEDSISTSA